jgi:hypothetical protein
VDEAKEEEKKKFAQKMLDQLQDNFRQLVRHFKENAGEIEVIKQLRTGSNSVNPELVDLVHCIKC